MQELFWLHLFYKLIDLNFYSNGKLLITSEYLVLDGAVALALPTVYGQNLIVKTGNNNDNILTWNSIDCNGKVWFNCKFKISSFNIISSSDKNTALTLQKILQEIKKINPLFLIDNNNIDVVTKLTFNKNWGLGTSSTLINNIANWGKVNAFDLQFKIFGGSAYDIACAQNNSPILYQLNHNVPTIKNIDFNPAFKEQLFFIYLNKKQNSRNAIKLYQNFKGNKEMLVQEISKLTNAISSETSFSDFENIVKEHEKIISKVTQTKPIQDLLFSDYFGQIKSLGAWGGDFILATGSDDSIKYFKNKGFDTVIPYSKIILAPIK